jgi:hypothetical protein
MTSTATSLHGALCIDFTGSVEGFRQLSGFGPELVSLIRNGAPHKILVVIDRAVGAAFKQPVLVRDHLNLTGNNPLIGPNDPCGARFPVVQGVYVEDVLPDLKQVVAAGLKPGLVPTADDQRVIGELGAEVGCYNVVPTMLVCAHAGWRVLALLVPEGQKPTADLLKAVQTLTGEGK